MYLSKTSILTLGKPSVLPSTYALSLKAFRDEKTDRKQSQQEAIFLARYFRGPQQYISASFGFLLDIFWSPAYPFFFRGCQAGLRSRHCFSLVLLTVTRWLGSPHIILLEIYIIHMTLLTIYPPHTHKHTMLYLTTINPTLHIILKTTRKSIQSFHQYNPTHHIIHIILPIIQFI